MDYVSAGSSEITSSGNPAAGAGSNIQTRIAKTAWSNYTQTNDYSFSSSSTAFTDWTFPEP